MLAFGIAAVGGGLAEPFSRAMLCFLSISAETNRGQGTRFYPPPPPR